MTTQLPYSYPFTPPHYPPRKRRAHTPPSIDPEPSKRRRPNLTNGFSGLSIEPDAAPIASDLDDDDETPAQYRIGSPRDVRVEELPEIPSRQVALSSSDSDEGYDSTFRLPPPRHRRYARLAQQPDEIQMPLETPIVPIDYEDVTERPTRGVKRREVFSDSPAKRRRDDMDMDQDEVTPRRRTEWYEPEKDRIVITSLGSPSSSRSSSEEPPRHLSQPGDQGFTLNPSFLTHLIKSQKDQFTPKRVAQQSLVLYRRPPEWPDVVRHWQIEDPGRFEEVDDDEDLSMAADADRADVVDDSMGGADMDGDISMD